MVTTADKKSWGETWREVGTSLWEARGWSKINGIVRVIILTIVSASSFLGNWDRGSVFRKRFRNRCLLDMHHIRSRYYSSTRNF